MISMSRELVLIPKEEYESLLQTKQENGPPDHLTNEKDETVDTKHPMENKEMQLQESMDKNELVKDNTKEPQPEMKGTGKKYVRQSIDKFLKQTTQYKGKKRQKKDSKSRRNLIKHKWIHY